MIRERYVVSYLFGYTIQSHCLDQVLSGPRRLVDSFSSFNKYSSAHHADRPWIGFGEWTASRLKARESKRCEFACCVAVVPFPTELFSLRRFSHFLCLYAPLHSCGLLLL